MKEYVVKVYDNKTLWFNKDGQLHREDGPAVELADGAKSWYLKGKELTEEEFLQRTLPVQEMTIEEVCKALGKIIKIVK